MINIVNPIPSAVMLESYNNKIKKLLKYSNGEDVTWSVNDSDVPGEVDVTINLPGGSTKVVKVVRSDISTKLPNDVGFDYVTVNVDVVDSNANIAFIQNEIMKASNINKANYDMIYSSEFAMSVLLWVCKGIYIPPTDMILTEVNNEVPETLPPLGEIPKPLPPLGELIPELGEPVPETEIIKFTEVKIKSNSLAYVGSVRIAHVSNITDNVPTEMAEYNLSEYTNVGKPGQWEVNYDVNSAWREESAVNDIATTILDVIGTEVDFQPEWGMLTTTKDLEFNVPGKISYIVTPSSETPLFRLIGEFRLTITQTAGGAVGRAPNVSKLNIPNVSYGNSGRRIATINTKVTDEQLLSQVQTAIASAYKNDISSGNTLTQDDLNLGVLDLVDITITGDVVRVEPKPEYAYLKANGLLLISINRVDADIELINVTSVFGKESTEFTYRVNPILTDDQIKYNVLSDILKPHMLAAANTLTNDDLVATIEGNTLTVTPTAEAAGIKINCNVVVTINRLVARTPIVNLNALYNYEMPEPDKTVENYDFKNVIENLLLDLVVAAGSDEIIDIDSMVLSYEDKWNGGYVMVPFPEMDYPVIGSVHFRYTDIRPVNTHTDLSSISNISKPGTMIVSKTLVPKYSSVSVGDLIKVLEVATEGTFDINKLSFVGTYSNRLLNVKPNPYGQPNAVVGELNVLYATLDNSGNWIPTLNLSEITNNDTPGLWNFTVLKQVTADNYTMVANAVKANLQKIYSVNTDSLISAFDNGILTLTVDPNALIDATGTLTINAVVNSNIVQPSDALAFTSVTNETTEEAMLVRISGENVTQPWYLWMDDEIVATSTGLIYNDNITIVNGTYNYIAIKLATPLFTSRTVKFSTNMQTEKMSLTGGNGLDRQTTVNSFGGLIQEHRFQMACLVELPSTLPANITSINSMLTDLVNFNQDLSGWDTSNVTDMGYMFSGCTSFNQDLSSWNTSNVTNMSVMFSSARAFNQDISMWDTSKVKYMDHMFQYASSFNQDLSGWNTSLITNVPQNFGVNADAWILPRPVWNTIDSGGGGR